jgi:hypothetical protein
MMASQAEAKGRCIVCTCVYPQLGLSLYGQPSCSSPEDREPLPYYARWSRACEGIRAPAEFANSQALIGSRSSGVTACEFGGLFGGSSAAPHHLQWPGLPQHTEHGGPMGSLRLSRFPRIEVVRHCPLSSLGFIDDRLSDRIVDFLAYGTHLVSLSVFLSLLLHERTKILLVLLLETKHLIDS